MTAMRTLLKAAALLKPREFAIKREACALCDRNLQVRLCRDEIAVRCLHCGASAITQSLVGVLAQAHGDLSKLSVYELSAMGPLVNWLRPRTAKLTTSEYFDGVAPGSEYRGVICQDVQRLTFNDASFDLCTSTEVFEHVADDMAGFREILRVLRPCGTFVFTVPLNRHGPTVERTELRGEQRVNILPVEYHADRYRGRRVFCYRNYAMDIVDRLLAAGFGNAEIIDPRQNLFGYARPVVVGKKYLPNRQVGGT